MDDRITLSVVMTKKMLNDESKNIGKFWPQNSYVKGNKSYRIIQTDEEEKEILEDWLDSYGCQWEEI